MKKITLGKTGIEVSELCFGALPIGPIQKNMDIEDAADLIVYALEKGVNYVDTAKIYHTYPHLKRALEKTDIRPIISSKSPANTYEEMREDINEALRELSLEYIDIFYLHAARADKNVIIERRAALDALVDAKKQGLIKAIGISTHNVEAVQIAAKTKEIDIVFPIININGLGILAGRKEDMTNAINLCFENNKGLMFMKALGGGSLVSRYKEAMDFVKNISKNRAVIAMGMLDKTEVDMNIKYFRREDITQELEDLKDINKRFMVVDGLCIACQKCIKNCANQAISLKEGKAFINDEKCIRCAYCVNDCKEFAIRMV